MDYGTAGTALTSGILFGYVLEQAGFGSPGKLTAQFRLSDWSVFKVMFTAILVAAAGILLLQADNTFGAKTFYIPRADLVAVAVGGALIGSGMALGGYCPGTSIVGIMTGRLDGLVFAFGMVAGIWIFSAEYDSAWLHVILSAGRIDTKTLPDLLGVSPWSVVLGMSIAALAGFTLGSRYEQRASCDAHNAKIVTMGDAE